MPIAKFQMPDGRIARFEVPEGTTPEQAQAMVEEYMASMPKQPAQQGGFADAYATAKETSGREQMTHKFNPTPAKDMYAKAAESQSFGKNVLSGAGGAMYGVGYLGPKSIFGLNKPGEVADWKASMSGLNTTAGGTIGQVLGYASPAAVAAPIVGASVPVATGVGALEGMLMPAESMAERGWNTVASAGGAALGQAGGNALAKRITKRAQDKAQEVAARKAQNAVRDTTLAMGKAEGYVVPPSYAGTGMWPRFFEGISGKYKTNQLAGIKNQEVTNKLARKALGMADDAPLTDDALESFRYAKSAPYREVANLPPRHARAASSNVDDWTAPVQQVKGFDPAKALEDLKDARFNSSMYWKHFRNSADPESRRLAVDAGKLADRLEDMIDDYARQNGSADLVERLRMARKDIAKSHTVERALNEGTGNVDATKLAKMIERGEFLDADLEKAGKFGMAFHDVARPPKSGDANPITALDFMAAVPTAGIGGAAWGGPGAMAMTLLPAAARVGARYGLLSNPVQRTLVNPKYSIGLLNKTLPPALNNPVSSALYPALGIYGYGVQPGLE